MICPHCQVWELLARDKVCSWCGTVLVRREADVSQASSAPSSAEARDMKSGRGILADFLGSRAEPERGQPGSPAPPHAEPIRPTAARPVAASGASPPFVPPPPPPPPRPAAPSQATYAPVSSAASGQVLPPYQPVVSAPRAPSYIPAPYPTPAKGPFRPTRPRAGRRFAAALFLILVTVILYALITPASEPALPTLSASPNPIQRGQRTVLHWSAKGYGKVELDGTPVEPTGSRAVYPSVSTTYRLVATERNGTPEVAETRVIVQGPPHAPAHKPR